ncbi:MAG TPA: flagellar biosynthesis protein FlhF, partial [Lysobacter sp.]
RRGVGVPARQEEAVRIKRFIAPDMRTALRMVRDEQGPDAVILSNRAVDGGIEVVAATDYDESLVTQALRAALPTMDTAPAIVAPVAQPVASPMPAMAIAASPQPPVATAPMPAQASAFMQRSVVAEHVVAAAAPARSQASPAPRESLVARARAVFKVGDGPTLAELTTTTTAKAHQAALAPMTHAAAAVSVTTPAPTTPFEAMMSALDPADAPAPALAASEAVSALDSAADYLSIPGTVAAAPVSAVIDAPIASDEDGAVEPTPESSILRAVTTAIEQPDPALVSMRAELSSMRQLIEKQMEQLSLERLRGSPARAAAYEALLEFGCEDVLAQAVAARIDPRLEPAQILEPMLAELARMLTVARSETIDDGGVIALVGPTGSGKTTTAAKLAARFAARHRARDVALVTIDGERAGAREQLHAHGRRLGITVCEAAGPDGLQAALAQLTDYPLVIVDTPGFAPRDRGLFGQILWLHQSRNVRSLLVLPANAHPHDLSEVVRRYGPAAPEGVVLTKVDEAGRMGSALSVAVRHGLTLAYTTHGQNVPDDIDTADATRLAKTLEKVRRAADNPLATEERHAVA